MFVVSTLTHNILSSSSSSMVHTNKGLSQVWQHLARPSSFGSVLCVHAPSCTRTSSYQIVGTLSVAPSHKLLLIHQLYIRTWLCTNTYYDHIRCWVFLSFKAFECIWLELLFTIDNSSTMGLRVNARVCHVHDSTMGLHVNARVCRIFKS